MRPAPRGQSCPASRMQHIALAHASCSGSPLARRRRDVRPRVTSSHIIPHRAVAGERTGRLPASGSAKADSLPLARIEGGRAGSIRVIASASEGSVQVVAVSLQAAQISSGTRPLLKDVFRPHQLYDAGCAWGCVPHADPVGIEARRGL